jgi:hypothetical protein
MRCHALSHPNQSRVGGVSKTSGLAGVPGAIVTLGPRFFGGGVRKVFRRSASVWAAWVCEMVWMMTSSSWARVAGFTGCCFSFMVKIKIESRLCKWTI